jgi:hypothetical protein
MTGGDHHITEFIGIHIRSTVAGTSRVADASATVCVVADCNEAESTTGSASAPFGDFSSFARVSASCVMLEGASIERCCAAPMLLFENIHLWRFEKELNSRSV